MTPETKEELKRLKKALESQRQEVQAEREEQTRVDGRAYYDGRLRELDRTISLLGLMINHR